MKSPFVGRQASRVWYESRPTTLAEKSVPLIMSKPRRCGLWRAGLATVCAVSGAGAAVGLVPGGEAFARTVHAQTAKPTQRRGEGPQPQTTSARDRPTSLSLDLLPSRSAASPVPYPIQPVAPTISRLPVIAGKALVGQTLSVSEGEWSGTSPISYSYQWSVCTPKCEQVAGAHDRDFALSQADFGATVAASVTASNAAGAATAITKPVGPVIAGANGSGACTAPAGPRDPANPLVLGSSPGTDPLHGAHFFIDGPTHGAAAGEIARLLGSDNSVPAGSYLPAFPDSESWHQFLTTTVGPRLLHASAAIRRKVELLEKIASQPEAQRISVASEGGTPAGIAAFTNKLFCHNFNADPGTIPIISTYFMHPVLGGCSSTAQINAYLPLFERRINALAQATGNHAVVYLLELDAVGSSSCMAAHHSLAAWENMLRYEVGKIATLRHAVVYIEGGYSDANTPRYAARILNAVDIRRVRGFFTNDTHNNWTINEIRYGEAISRLTHGAHFIVDTAQNGNGPKLNPHPATQGVEDLCNPPGRGLGPRDTTTTGYPDVDAFLWTHTPANSSGHCNGGPASGTFWPAWAISLAANANARLGPNFPSQPY